MKPVKFLMAVAGFSALSIMDSAQADSMTISSSSFRDGGKIPQLMAGNGAECGDGSAITPAVKWADLPQGTQSIAVVLFDPDGGKGQGVVHWVAYNIPATREGFKEGEAPQSMDNVTIGMNSAAAEAYRGLCPPAGDSPHHYVLTVIATEKQPGSIPAGLDRAGLLNAIKDHSLAAVSIVGRYGH